MSIPSNPPPPPQKKKQKRKQVITIPIILEIRLELVINLGVKLKPLNTLPPQQKKKKNFGMESTCFQEWNEDAELFAPLLEKTFPS